MSRFTQHHPVYIFEKSISPLRLSIRSSSALRAIMCCVLFICINNIYSQQVGIGTETPNLHAALEIADTTRGVLLPRMDSVHRINIPNTEGLIVYDSSYHALFLNNGDSWQKIQSTTSIPAIQEKTITKESWWTAMGNSTTIDVSGFGNSTTGTATTRNVASINLFTSLRRVGYVSNAAAGSSAGTRHGFLQFWRGNAPGLGGFLYIARFGISSASSVSTQRSFAGLAGTSSSLGNADPSTNINILGFGVDASDDSWFFMHNDGSGSAIKEVLTGTFPPRSLAIDMFEIRIYCPANGDAVYYSIEVLGGGSYYSGSTNVNLPSSTSFLSPQIWTNNGSTALSCGIDIVYQYIQTLN